MRLAIHASLPELASKALLAVSVLVHIRLVIWSIIIRMAAIVCIMLTLAVRLLVYVLLRGDLLARGCWVGGIVTTVLVIAKAIWLLLGSVVSKLNAHFQKIVVVACNIYIVEQESSRLT